MSDSNVAIERLAAGLARYRPLVDDWDAFIAALARPLPTCVWANTARVGADVAHELLQEDELGPLPLAWRPAAYRLTRGGPADRWWYAAGLFHVQEEASMLPVHLLDPRPGERVLDLCAAPGGKTAQIALAVGPAGTVVANDLSASRLRALRGTLDRLGGLNVTVTQHDGGNYPPVAGPFDRVLVDAPCSGEGTLRRRIGKKPWSGRERSVGFAAKQVALLRKAARLCRPGGRIVYSTCTFAPEENEAIVDSVLGHYPNFDLQVIPAPVVGLRTGPGTTTWEDQVYRDDLRHAQRIWPHHGDTGGFFVAVIEKRGGAADGDGAAWPIEPAPRADWWDVTAERFGISPSVWDGLVVHRKSTTGLHVVARGHRPPCAPEPAALGLRFLSDGGTHPKLTTTIALVLAGEATRNVVDLDAPGAARFLAREDQPLTALARERCAGTGYVLVRHRGFGLGVGVFLDERQILRSQFPKRWSC